MSVITIKINDKLALEYVYDKKNDLIGFKLLFKFDSHNPTWMFLKLNKNTINILQKAFKICLKN